MILKKNSQISYFEFNITPTTANKKIKFKKREINNLIIVATKIGQKRKMSEIAETLLIKALQNYDKYTILNPLQVNYLTQKMNEYKGYIYEVMLKNVLFSAAIKNDTQNIFVICQNLNCAKKALINGKIYDLLAIINLSEIKIGNQLKENQYMLM